MFLIKGILIGIFISLPFGPVGIICLKNIIVEGRRLGFASGLGAASSDILYSLLASIGVSSLNKFLFENELPIKLILSIFLIALGAKIFFTNPVKERKIIGTRFISSYMRLFVLGLSNIGTVFLFLGIFTALNLFIDITLNKIIFLVIGIFLGSVIWWLLLSQIIHIFNYKVKEKHLKYLNQISGILVFLFGVSTIIYIIMKKNNI
jgi:threonine/homoserine/homoserine lactone efflux protein